MKPVLFHFGPLPLYSFGFTVALGLALCLWLMQKRAARTGFPEKDGAFDLTFIVVVSGFIGARVYYVFQNLSWYLENPLKIFAFWEGGLIFYGGMFSAILALGIFGRLKKISLLKILDFLLPYTALAHAFGRLGCFLNGCCYGKICHLPWAVTFPGHGHPVHPSQLYEAGLDLVLFLFLNARYSRKKFEGEIALFYFMLYAVIRFLVEFSRDDNPFLGPLTINQWLSGAVFAAAGAVCLFRGWKRNNEGNPGTI